MSKPELQPPKAAEGKNPALTVADVVAGLPATWLTPAPPASPAGHEPPSGLEPPSGPAKPAGPAGRPITGGYACDMLSLVISGVQPGEAWFTILNSMNVIAVAVLSECALVVLTGGVTMEPVVLERAIQQGITVVSTELTTYQACVRLNALLAGSCGPG